MDAEFYAAIASDTVLSAVLLGLFVYVSRIARERLGIQAWGWGHFAYTLGSALIDAGANRVAEGHPDMTLDVLAGLGTVLSTCGLTGLAWSVTAIATQRPLRRGERAWMPVAAVAGVAAGAWFLASPTTNFATPGLAMTLFELATLGVIVWRLRLLDRVPYRLPARLMQVVCAILIWMYAADLLRIVGREAFARYVPAVALVHADVSLWFLLNFCMLMIVSFRAVETYRQSAHVDPLTGLLNRRGMQAMLRQQLRDRPPAAGTPISVIMMDLDHFKSVNDRFGHARGDIVLRQFAAAVERTVRSGDLPTRVGGEEFAVVLVDASPAVALDLAERLRQRVADTHLDEVDPGLRVTTSVGVANGVLPGASVQDLMDAADAALYAAKAAGRDRVVVAPAPPSGTDGVAR